MPTSAANVDTTANKLLIMILGLRFPPSSVKEYLNVAVQGLENNGIADEAGRMPVAALHRRTELGSGSDERMQPMGERADWTGVADRRIVGAEQTRRSWLRAGAL